MFTAEEQIAELGYFGQTELEFLPVLRGGKKLFEKAEVAILILIMAFFTLQSGHTYEYKMSVTLWF